MPIRINTVQLQIEQAAGGSNGPARGLWMGYLTSGVTHLAGGLLLGSVWGSSLLQLVPPPHGTNAIELAASPLVVLTATPDDDAEQTMPVTIPPDTIPPDTIPPDESIGGARQQLRSFVGEMPPVSVSASATAPTAGVSSSDLTDTSSLEATTPPKKVSQTARPQVEPTVTPSLQKKPAPQPPGTPSTAAAPALPSMRQQGQDAESPQQVYSPAPAYPAVALRQGITGRVVLRVKVDTDGKVIAASVLQSSGHAILDEAALAGVRQWRFEPAQRLGVAVEKEIAVPITFRIDRSR